MTGLVGLYLSYLKSAVLVMLWAALTFAAYAFIRSSTVAEVVVAAAVALVLSLGVALPLMDYLSPSHAVRRTLAAVFASLLALLLRQEARSGQKQQI